LHKKLRVAAGIAKGRERLRERVGDGRDRLKLGLFVAQIAAFVGGSVLTAVGLVESDVPVAVVGLSLSLSFIGGTLVLFSGQTLG